MSELVQSRSCIASHNNNLKRSKSVRESLRIIGTKFLPYQRHIVTKSPSLSDIHEQKDGDCAFKFFVEDNFNNDIETILKTPVSVNSGSTNQLSSFLHLKKTRDVSHPKRQDNNSLMPVVVNPKAAALLEIPLQDNNYHSVQYRYPSDIKYHAIYDKTNRNLNYNRSSFRLYVDTRRRNTMWSSFFSASKLSSYHEMDLASIPQQPQGSNKFTKKQMKLMQQRQNRLTRVNIHLHALFGALENGHLEKARTILESTDVNVNSLNCDGLSALDVAVLSNNRPLVKMLTSFGAKEGNQFNTPELLEAHLKQLLSETELRQQKLTGVNTFLDSSSESHKISFSSGHFPSSVPDCTGGDTEKQLLACIRRSKVLRKMLLGFVQLRPPDFPSLVTVEVTDTATVTVRIQEPSSQDAPLTTRYKIQWSTRADFNTIAGECELLDTSNPQCVIKLSNECKFFFRAACGNVKGYGNFFPSTPEFVIPSSWKQVDQKESRFEGRSNELDELIDDMKQIYTDSELLENPTSHKRAQRKKTTIKQLFSVANKFQKHLRRGIYFACILYHDDKVLVTNEDFIPVIEIDETYPGYIQADFYWLMKIACTWNDTKAFKADMEKHASSNVHFRTKLLSAALQMQSALGLQDLGQLYYKPLRDSNGTMILSTINYMQTPKSISLLNTRWIPLSKIHKKSISATEENNVADILMMSIQEQINYHQASRMKLSRGLYMGYLKLQSSIDLIQVIVPTKSPNVLPHCKIRENPHVTAEEWNFLKSQHKLNIYEDCTDQQRFFLDLIITASKRLFKFMNINEDDAVTHQLYDYEVININEDISFIIICPPAESTCAITSQRETSILQRNGDFLCLPIQVFEMIHLNTYQNAIVQKYSRLNCILELDAATASHMHREAFSNTELAVAKERLVKLQEFQVKLNAIWKQMRWLIDMITYSRNKSTNCILMKYFLKKSIEKNPEHPMYNNMLESSSSLSSSSSSLLLLLSFDASKNAMKNTSGRGSWSGPSTTILNSSNKNCCLTNEFSKSEQHLSGANENDEIFSSEYLDTAPEVKDEVFKKPHPKNCDKKYFCNNTSSNSHISSKSKKIQLSKSENILYNQPKINYFNKTNNTERNFISTTVTPVTSVNSTKSASTSPLLNIKPKYSGSLLSVNTSTTTNTMSDSMLSLNSDSDNVICFAPTSTASLSPHKQKTSSKTVTSLSKSMQNVKPQNDYMKFERKYSQQNYLIVNPHNNNNNNVTSSNLETTSSKSLSNLEKVLDPEMQQLLTPTKKQQQPPDLISNAILNAPFVSTGGGLNFNNNNNALPTTSSSAKDSGILQVYAAYETGLASGTSLKLHVTSSTTAREVVDLVVKQLNMAVVLKGKDGPIYTNDKLKNFCLVTVIGARERCLRDDFKPLQLQNPWKTGRLYVRQKNDVLAALEHSSKRGIFI